MTEDGGGLNVDGVISSHLSVGAGSCTDGHDDGPDVIASSVGTKGGNSFSDEENSFFCMNTTIAMGDSEEIADEGARTESLEEVSMCALTFEQSVV